jgi:hypothetical protein
MKGMPCIDLVPGVTARITQGFLVVIRDFSVMRAPDLRYWLRAQPSFSPEYRRK